MKQNNTQSGGIGFASLLLLAFIILKICKQIDWSWWWVLSPLWILPMIYVIIFVVGFVVLLFIKRKPPIKQKSRWQMRMEEMQKNQNNKQ